MKKLEIKSFLRNKNRRFIYVYIKIMIKFLYRAIDLAIVLTYYIILIYILTGGFKYALIDSLSVNNLFRPLVVISILFGLRMLLKYGFKVGADNELFENPGNLFIIAVLSYVIFTIPVVINGYHSFKLDNLLALLLPKAGFQWLANLFPNPLVVINGQIVAVSLGSIPIYVMAKRILKNRWWALGIASMFLFSPLANGARFFEFRWDYFVMPVVLYGFYFLVRGEFLYFILCFLLGFINWYYNPISVVERIWDNSLTVPIIFILVIYIIRFLLRLVQRYKWFLPYVRLGCIWIPLFFGISNYNKYIISPLAKERLYERYKTDVYDEFFKIKRSIPSEAVLLTTDRIFPHFIGRDNTYSFQNTDFNMEEIDYILYYDSFRTTQEAIFFDHILSSPNYIRIHNWKGLMLFANKRSVYKDINWAVNFRKDFANWKYSPCNVEFGYKVKDNFLELSAVFDGKADEDEFIQMRAADIKVDLLRYPYLEFEYKIENTEVQFVEIVLGIDINGDGSVDKYFHLYPEGHSGKFYKYEAFIYKIYNTEFPEAETVELLKLELYPHKRYELDCSQGDRKGEYKFWFKRVYFYGFRYKGR